MTAVLVLLAALASPRALARPGALGQVVSGNARFTVITPECFRLEYDPQGRFVDLPSIFAVNRGERWLDASVVQSATQTVIDTGRMRLVYTPDGRPFSGANLKVAVYKGGETVTWTPEMKYNRRNLGGTRNLDQLKGPATTEQGLLARDGWHLLDDSQRFLLKDDWVVLRPKDGELDWYLFGYGDDYKGALKALTAIGGAVPLPRKYVLGSWYSRWWPYSAKDYQDIVAQYHEHGFPLDVLVMDMDWHKKDDWTGYTWNRELFPEPEKYLAWVHSQRLFATLNDHAEGGVKPFEANYETFMRSMGQDPASQKTLPYDAGDRKYLWTVFRHMHEPVERQGADFWWLDFWSDDKAYPYNRLVWMNEFYYRHSQLSGLRGQSFSRWGDWGDHRHPVLFSGDTAITWPMLAYEVTFSADSGNMGAFYWSHDIGGYGFGDSKRNGELLARWAQFGAFSAALRLHSVKRDDLDKRPWTYEKAVEDSMRASFRLRSELFPYTYSLAWQAYSESLPLLRPMYLELPREEEAYKSPQEYLYGPAFLVAPIVSAGSGEGKTASQRVWLPPGAWYDWFTGERFEGPRRLEVSKPLDSFPLFVQGGIPVPMQPFAERMASEPLTTLVVRAYPGEEGKTGEFVLYEDDGLTKDYVWDNYGLTPLSYRREKGSVTVTVGPTARSYKGQVARREIVVELAGAAKASRAEVDGRPAALSYDEKSRTNRVAVPRRGIREGAVVTVWD